MRFEPLFACLPFLVFLVEAPHLDLSGNRPFLCSMAKHPSNWSKNGDVGHAWLYLQKEGLYIEGGHSGELGEKAPTYFDGMMRYVANGDPNPVKYLWESLPDGFFQWGAGGHRPTYAVAVRITSQQFDDIASFLASYDYGRYALRDHQCCTLVVEAAARLGLQLDVKEKLPIESQLRLKKEVIPLWSDPRYKTLAFESPDRLEKELKRLVAEKKAVPALAWYLKRRHRRDWSEVLRKFPSRYARWCYFREALRQGEGAGKNQLGQAGRCKKGDGGKGPAVE